MTAKVCGVSEVDRLMTDWVDSAKPFVTRARRGPGERVRRDLWMEIVLWDEGKWKIRMGSSGG